MIAGVTIASFPGKGNEATTYVVLFPFQYGLGGVDVPARVYFRR